MKYNRSANAIGLIRLLEERMILTNDIEPLH